MARGLGAVVLLVLVGLGGLAIWDRLDGAGYVPHEEMTIVYSPDWHNGEYKICSTQNGNGYKSPEHSSTPQNILCDGGVPSGRLEDGKVFKVQFWGKTFIKTKPFETPLLWNCLKSDAYIVCEQEKTHP